MSSMRLIRASIRILAPLPQPHMPPSDLETLPLAGVENTTQTLPSKNRLSNNSGISASGLPAGISVRAESRRYRSSRGENDLPLSYIFLIVATVLSTAHVTGSSVSSTGLRTARR